MIIFIDTNIILDIFLRRDPFFKESYQALTRLNHENSQIMFSASSVTDVFYILRKYYHSSLRAKEQIEKLGDLVKFANVLSQDLYTALNKEMADFEDALIEAVAERYHADFILTRNKKDFKESAVPVLTPKEFLEIS